MDFKNVAISTEAQEVELIMQDGTKTGIFFELVGQDSKKYKDFDRQLAIKQLKKMADKKGNISFNASKLDETLNEREKNKVEQAAVCIVGWKNVKENDKQIPYSHEKAVELLSIEGMDWVVDFINEYTSDRVNFIKG